MKWQGYTVAGKVQGPSAQHAATIILCGCAALAQLAWRSRVDSLLDEWGGGIGSPIFGLGVTPFPEPTCR
jgi:hypothetical protein